MIKLGSKKSSLLLGAIMLAKFASAQGLPWLYDPPPQTPLVQTATPEQTQLPQTMALQVATTPRRGQRAPVFILKLSIPWCRATAW